MIARYSLEKERVQGGLQHGRYREQGSNRQHSRPSFTLTAPPLKPAVRLRASMMLLLHSIEGFGTAV
jgi:hypothetical protein